MNTIEQIRTEIERQRKAIRVLNEHTGPGQMSKTCAIFQYSDAILSELLSFLDTLQEPDVDLEEEVEKYFQGLWPGMETAEQCNTDMHFTPPAIMRLAHHFAVWGAEHASGKEQKVDLEKKECELVTADEDIITIHLGKVLTEEQYDAILRSVIDHFNKHWSHIL